MASRQPVALALTFLYWLMLLDRVSTTESNIVAVNSFQINGEYVFQDMFLSCGKVYFVAAPTPEEVRASSLGAIKRGLYTPGFFTLDNPWGGSPFVLEADVNFVIEDTESNIIGEIYHKYFKRVMALQKFLRIIVNFNSTKTATFELNRQNPRLLRGEKFRISLFTLFKTNKPIEISLFVEYYRGMGVDYFLLYLNGRFSDYPDILALSQRYALEGVPVTFAEWDYTYRLQPSRLHNAQITAMHSALLRMKGFTTWLGFFDTDEFIVTVPPDYSLRDRMDRLSSITGVVLFNNRYSHHNNYTEIATQKQFFFRHTTYETIPDWGHSKFFIKPALVQGLNVHHPRSEFLKKPKSIGVEKVETDYFLHFHNEHHEVQLLLNMYRSPKNISNLIANEYDDYSPEKFTDDKNFLETVLQ